MELDEAVVKVVSAGKGLEPWHRRVEAGGRCQLREGVNVQVAPYGGWVSGRARRGGRRCGGRGSCPIGMVVVGDDKVNGNILLSSAIIIYHTDSVRSAGGDANDGTRVPDVLPICGEFTRPVDLTAAGGPLRQDEVGEGSRVLEFTFPNVNMEGGTRVVVVKAAEFAASRADADPCRGKHA